MDVGLTRQNGAIGLRALVLPLGQVNHSIETPFYRLCQRITGSRITHHASRITFTSRWPGPARGTCTRRTRDRTRAAPGFQERHDLVQEGRERRPRPRRWAARSCGPGSRRGRPRHGPSHPASPKAAQGGSPAPTTACRGPGAPARRRRRGAAGCRERMCSTLGSVVLKSTTP